MDRWKNAIFHAFNYGTVSLFALVCTYPFYYIFIQSISDPALAKAGKALLWPAGLTLNNYDIIFGLSGIGNAFLVSSSRAVAGTLLTLLFSSLFAYTMTKRELPFRAWMYRATVITLYLNAGLIPWYITMVALGLKNTFLLYVLPFAVQPFLVILIKTYMESIPAAIEESAMMDGAGYLKIFLLIVMPLSLPILAAICVFSAVAQWNSWYDNFFLVSDSKLQTLQLLMLNKLREAETISRQAQINLDQARQLTITPTSIRMTMTMAATLPVIMVYPFLQKYFVKGIMLGAVKG